MDLFKAIRLQALLVVLQPDQSYETRKILRWYSKTYSTPLPQVEELPLEEVVQAYYEEKFESFDEETLDQIKQELLETEDARARRCRKEDAEFAEEDAFIRMTEQEEKAKEVKQASKELPKPAEQALLHASGSLRKEQELPDVPVILPDITMKFEVNPEDFDRELEGLGTMDQPPKGQS